MKKVLVCSSPYFGLISILIFFGCSNNYIEKNYSSKKEYLSQLRNSTRDRSVNIKFLNDTSVSSDSIKITSDSVEWRKTEIDKSDRKIPVSATSKIDYNKYSSVNPAIFDANIRLKNNSDINVYGARFKDDSIIYHLKIQKSYSQPLNKVNSISFTNHLKGMGNYGLAGAVLGGMVGYKYGTNAAIRDRQPVPGTIAGAAIFGLGGLITGLIVGNHESYTVNENHSATYKILQRFGLIGGITSSYVNGNFSDNRTFDSRAKADYTFGLFYTFDLNGTFTLRPEIVYTQKGGNFDYRIPSPTIPVYQSQTSTVYLDLIELPMLLQYSPFYPKKDFVKIYIGPSINVPIKGEYDEYYVGPMDNVFGNGIHNLSPNIYLSAMFGLGIKWDAHFSIEIFYDRSFTKIGQAQLTDGSIMNIKQSNIFVTTTFTL